MEQRTDEWFAARLGKVTASRVADVVAKTKNGYSASRDNYMADLIVERLTGQKASSFSNAAMEWGTEQEPNARAAYSARTGELVEEVGFIDHPAIPMSGASPDGLVAEGRRTQSRTTDAGYTPSATASESRTFQPAYRPTNTQGGWPCWDT